MFGLDWRIAAMLWCLVGWGVHALRRLSYMMLWEKSGGKARRGEKLSNEPISNYFMPMGSELYYPGTNIAEDFFYWLFVMVVWPGFITIGFPSTFQGIVWLWDNKKEEAAAGVSGFWLQFDRFTTWLSMSPAERRARKDVAKIARDVERLQTILDLREQEAQLQIKKDQLHHQVFTAEMKPFSEGELQSLDERLRVVEQPKHKQG